MSTARFDDEDRLNDDGTVTFRMVPSNWHRAGMSPDTYQMFTGDSWNESEIEHFREETGRDLSYDDFIWTYDHASIVRDLSQELTDWLAETLDEAGLKSASVRLVDTWSPREYNFTSDGFEVEVTCDPAELRDLTPDFDVDEWGKFYRSYDGFISFVTSRLNDDDWHADYDAEFRVESLLAEVPEVIERDWIMRLAEAETEVYCNNVTVELKEDEYMDSGFTLSELEEYAETLTPTQPETLFA